MLGKLGKFLAALICFASINAWSVTGELLTVTTEEGQPLAGVEVLVGRSLNDPFANNLFRTDMNGQVLITSDWNSAQPVTLSAPGYRRSTFMALKPVSAVLQMHQEDARTPLEIKGQANQFPSLKSDGRVDFAFVFPAMQRRDLVQFDMTNMISPDVDKLTVFNESMEVPSNLSLPTQKETYILPITLSKPEYRMFLRRPGNYRMMATHGQFPLKQVVNDFRAGKSFLDVMKHFRFIGAGQKDISATSSVGGHDIPVNQIPFDRAIKAEAPQGMPSNLAFVMFSMVDQAGLYFPADVKSLSAGDKTQLFVPSGSKSNYIVTLAVDRSRFDNQSTAFPCDPDGTGCNTTEETEDALTENSQLILNLQNTVARTFRLTLDKLMNIIDVSGPPSPDAALGGVSIAVHKEDVARPLMLDPVQAPKISGRTITMSPPRLVAGIEPIGTQLVLSEVEKAPKGDKRPDRSFRLWETFQNEWVNTMELPEVTLNLDPKKSYSWEVLFLGKTTGDNSTDEVYILDEVTHITRNSLEF